MEQIINCGLLIDGTLNEPREKCSVILREGTIVDIKPTFSHSKSSSLLNWENYVVIPGLFECHDHPTEDFGAGYTDEEERMVTGTLRGVRNCLDILKSGINTVRDCGAMYAINLKIKNAINTGLIQGPDIIAPGNRISRTGYPKWEKCREADGCSAVLQAVRQEQKRGADFIKLMVTGIGGNGPCQPEYSPTEIETAVAEAHRLGLKIGVHAHGGPAADTSINSGVDNIEHGTYLSDSNLEAMSRKNISLVVTIPAPLHNSKNKIFPSLSDSGFRDFFGKPYADTVKALQRAKAAKILFSVGGDINHGDPGSYMKALIDSGLTPQEALTVLTRESAKICGLEDIKGTIEIGKQADLVALAGNPLENTEMIRHVKGVMKRGCLLESIPNFAN